MYDCMKMVREKLPQGRPKYVGVNLSWGVEFLSADIVQNWKENPVELVESVWPCAVMVFFLPSRFSLAMIEQFWRTAMP